MLSRTFTVDVSGLDLDEEVHCYKGFNRQYEDAPYIALVQEEDVVETWALDDSAHALAELKRYYAKNKEFHDVDCPILGVYVNTRILR